jgi:hypothetical protein
MRSEIRTAEVVTRITIWKSGMGVLMFAWGRSRCWTADLRGMLGSVQIAVGVCRGEATRRRRTKWADIVLYCRS